MPPGAGARRRAAVVGALLTLGWLATLEPATSAATTTPSARSAGRAAGAPTSARRSGHAAGSPARAGATGRSGGPATGGATGLAASRATGTPPGPGSGSGAGAAAALGGPGSAATGPAGSPGDAPPRLRFPLWPPTTPPLTVLPLPDLPGLPAAAAAGPRVDCRKVKCIALTFDDGPGPYTRRLLGMLAAAHARATFFLIGGNIRGREAIVRQELAQGNAIGDHTWTHPELSLMSDHAIRSQLARTLAEIKRATGGGTPLMRPPYGATNHRVAAVAREMGFAQILWSVDTNDWRDRNARIVAHRAVSWAHRGDIILMHDIHPTTVAAVPQILRGLARRGFTFVTVPELFGDHPLHPGGTYFDGPPVPVQKPAAAKKGPASAANRATTTSATRTAPGTTPSPGTA